MSKAADHLRPVAADVASGWLKFSILLGIAAGGYTAAVTYVSPALPAAFLIWEAVRAL